MFLLVKTVASALIVVSVSELAKRSSFAGALLASLPLISILSFTWLYLDTRDVEQVARLSEQIVWLVIPSLLLFVVLPPLLRHGVTFPVAMALASAATVLAYFLVVFLMGRFS